MLRWSAAAACVVVVGTAVSLYRRANPLSEAPRKYSVVAEKEAASPSPQGLTAQPPEATRRDAGTRSPAEDKLIANAAPAPASPDQQAAAAKGDLSPAGRALSKQFGREGPAKLQEAASSPEHARADNRPPIPAASQVTDAVASGTSAGELDTKAEQRNKQVDEFYFKDSGQLADKATPTLAEGVAGKAKDTAQRAKAPAAGMVGGAMVANGKLARSEAAENELKSSYASNLVLPRWTLSSDGSLQRSLDAGKTWQAIPVPGNVTFRALAAVGVEIWVGGAKGTLYHSSDAGEHWVQVKPTAGGKPLTADIIGVEFTDARHGKLTTAANETWTTADAGQTWDRK